MTDANAAVVVSHPISSPTAQLTPATAAPATTTFTRVIHRRRVVTPPNWRCSTNSVSRAATK